MFQEILACLDGSELAEKILPLAHALSASKGGKLVLLRVVGDAAELAAEEESLRASAQRYSAELRCVVSADPAAAIGVELERGPHRIAALTTHGRSAWVEAILGSVALRVIREARRPVIVFRPLEKDREAPSKVDVIAVALDGSRFAEKIIPHAVKAAQYLSARLQLLQVLPVLPVPADLTLQEMHDVHESSYLHRRAGEIKAAHGLDVQWEVLHGTPAEAICGYLNDMPDTLLAMTTYARSSIERTVLGSVAGSCVRHAGVPMMLYWPR